MKHQVASVWVFACPDPLSQGLKYNEGRWIITGSAACFTFHRCVAE